MFTRPLAVVLLLASPLAAETITITEGSYDRINLNESRDLLMTGGTIGYLNNVGGHAVMKDGRIESGRVMFQGSLSIEGVDIWSRVSAEQGMGKPNGATIEIHGYNFRVDTSDPGDESSSGHNVFGWFLDGQYGEVALYRFGSPGQVTFRVVTHEPTFLDPDRDWDFDLEDLNAIRNSFGERRQDIDTNFDGSIDLADLNIVRNKFGGGYTYQPKELEFSGVIPLGNAARQAPEPASYITALLLAGLACIGTRCRYRSSLRQSS